MRKRTILYLLIAAWALLMLNGYYGVHDYVSLEGFPDVQVLNTRRISSGRFIQFGQEVPVEYAIVRDGYEIRIYIRETRNVPQAAVFVRSERPGIALSPLRQQGVPGYACPQVMRCDGPGCIENPKQLEFMMSCATKAMDGHAYGGYPTEYTGEDERAMRFLVVDELGPLAEERIAYRLKSGGIKIPTGY